MIVGDMAVRLLSLVLMLSVLVCGQVPLARAAESGVAGSGSFGRAPVPKPPKGKGDKCVADTDFMRRNHMDLLDHQRDDTVHEGIRTKKFSLNECITCHAVNGPDAKPVTVKDPKHFCRSCHDYAAVSIDCFQCHASRPVGGAAKQAASGERLRTNLGDAAALAGYLRSAQR